MDESKRWLYSFTEYKTGTELFSFNGFTGLSNALGSKKRSIARSPEFYSPLKISGRESTLILFSGQ